MLWLCCGCVVAVLWLCCVVLWLYFVVLWLCYVVPVHRRYFAMVRCAAAGVSLHDVEAHLNRRSLKLSRRPGHAKPERVAAAEKELGLA